MLKSILNSKNGGLIAAISGIVFIYIIDSIIQNGYSVHLDKESIEVVPPDSSASSQKNANGDKSNDENAAANNR